MNAEGVSPSGEAGSAVTADAATELRGEGDLLASYESKHIVDWSAEEVVAFLRQRLDKHKLPFLG